METLWRPISLLDLLDEWTDDEEEEPELFLLLLTTTNTITPTTRINTNNPMPEYIER